MDDRCRRYAASMFDRGPDLRADARSYALWPLRGWAGSSNQYRKISLSTTLALELARCTVTARGKGSLGYARLTLLEGISKRAVDWHVNRRR